MTNNDYVLEVTTEMLRDAEQKRDYYYWEHQNGGSGRTYSTYEKYDRLVTICQNAIENITEENERQVRRDHNYQRFIYELPHGPMFSRDEVVDLIMKTRYM